MSLNVLPFRGHEAQLCFFVEIELVFVNGHGDIKQW
jgi:hypothetical protein